MDKKSIKYVCRDSRNGHTTAGKETRVAAIMRERERENPFGFHFVFYQKERSAETKNTQPPFRKQTRTISPTIVIYDIIIIADNGTLRRLMKATMGWDWPFLLLYCLFDFFNDYYWIHTYCGVGECYNIIMQRFSSIFKSRFVDRSNNYYYFRYLIQRQ